VLKPYPNEFTQHLHKNAIHLFDQAKPYAMKDTIIEYQANTIGSFTSNARRTGHKEYEILVLSGAEVKDHLGNVRAVISDVKNPHNLASSISSWTFTAEIRNLNNYYPYGMELPGGAYASNGNYGYGYNGMEKDDELRESLYSTLFREGDTENGRWWKRDPMERALVGFSPYIMMASNPINMIDPNGDIPDFSPMKEEEDNQKLEEEDKPSNQILGQTRELTGLNLKFDENCLMVYDKENPYLYDEFGNIKGDAEARRYLKKEIDENAVKIGIILSNSGSSSIVKGKLLIDPRNFYMLAYRGDFYGITKETEGPGMVFLHEYAHIWFGSHTYEFADGKKLVDRKENYDNRILFYHITDDPVINFMNGIRCSMNKNTGVEWGEHITPLSKDDLNMKKTLILPYDMNAYYYLKEDKRYDSSQPMLIIQILYHKSMESKK
jgi:RHS repeat-associated protein